MEKSAMVLGIDDSDHSFYALKWTLQHFFSSGSEKSPYKLVIVHAKPFAANDVVRLAGSGTVGMVVPLMGRDLDVTAAGILQKAEEVCKAKSVNDMVFEVMEGNAHNVLCEAVVKHHASALIVGNHGYGVLRRSVLGSVSEYCAHNAHCNVMIVKMPPKIKL